MREILLINFHQSDHEWLMTIEKNICNFLTFVRHRSELISRALKTRKADDDNEIQTNDTYLNNNINFRFHKKYVQYCLKSFSGSLFFRDFKAELCVGIVIVSSSLFQLVSLCSWGDLRRTRKRVLY